MVTGRICIASVSFAVVAVVGTLINWLCGFNIHLHSSSYTEGGGSEYSRCKIIFEQPLYFFRQ